MSAVSQNHELGIGKRQERALKFWTPTRFQAYAWGVLAYTVLVILWGALVRGLGAVIIGPCAMARWYRAAAS